MKQVAILGSTGSIGVNTLDVIASHPDQFGVYAITANRNIDLLVQQIQIHKPKVVGLADKSFFTDYQNKIKACAYQPEVLCGSDGLASIASSPGVDIVMAAIVGAAGLAPTLAAARAGKRILLANKEALVVAGDLFMRAIQAGSAELLPIDSEHNAIYQCLPDANQTSSARGNYHQLGVDELVLTASGGPFRNWPIADLKEVTPEQACAHPNWVMGRKISVDSATMMNKGLEVIEAHHLFGMSADKIQVVIHPQSIVHSMVRYSDGSVIAQMGNPDMRIPIAYGLAWPNRMPSGVKALDLQSMAQLDFSAVDAKRFPCLNLAYQAIANGGTSSVALNAANEIAVDAFLNHQISFSDIYHVNLDVLNNYIAQAMQSIEQLQEEDLIVRRSATQILRKYYR